MAAFFLIGGLVGWWLIWHGLLIVVAIFGLPLTVLLYLLVAAWLSQPKTSRVDQKSVQLKQEREAARLQRAIEFNSQEARQARREQRARAEEASARMDAMGIPAGVTLEAYRRVQSSRWDQGR